MVMKYEDDLLGVSVRKGDGGLNTRDHPVEIADNEFVTLVNWDPRRNGLLQARDGNVTVGLASIAGFACHGLGYYNGPADTARIFGAFGATIYTWDGTSTIAALTGYAISSSDDVCFAQARTSTPSSDFMMFAISQNATPAVWDGSNLTLAPNVPRGTDAVFWLERLWVTGNPTMNGIVFPSSAGDPKSFNIVDGYAVGSGDPVQRIFNYLNQGLLVFLKHQIWFVNVDQTNIDGFVLDSTYVNVINSEIGAVAARSVVQAGREFFFLSRWGVHKLSKTEADRQIGVLEPISDKIKDTIDRIHWAYAHKASAVVWDNKYLLAVPLDSATANSHVLVYDIRGGHWSIYDGWGAGAWVRADVSGIDELYFGSSATVGQMYKAFSGTTDAGTNVTITAETKRFDFGEPFTTKVFEYLEVEASSTASTNFTVYAQREDDGYTVLGSVTVESNAVTLPVSLPFEFGSTALTRQKFDLTRLGKCREVQFKFDGNVNQDLTIVGYKLTGYVDQEKFD